MPKSLGACYVCGITTFGHVAMVRPTTYVGKGVVTDTNGVRHGTCNPFTRGSNVNPAHA